MRAPYCDALYNGPDGQPRIFKLEVLEANGSNAGRNKASWMPVIGATHPHCRCTTHPIPAGHGFSETGELVEGGTYGVRHDTEKSFLQSYVGERNLQKSFRTLESVELGGMSVDIHAGAEQLQMWLQTHGQRGETRMPYAYGQVQGMAKALHCCVGSDPFPTHVYIVRKNNPRTGYYDEDKVMLGFTSPHHAKAAFLAEHDANEDYFGSIAMVPIQEFANSLHGTTKALPIDTRADSAPIQKGPPVLKSTSTLRLTMQKNYSGQSIAAVSGAEDRNPSGGSGLDLKDGEIFPRPTASSKPDLLDTAEIFEGALLTEEEIERLHEIGAKDRDVLLRDAGYRERDVKPVKIPDEYAMMADRDSSEKKRQAGPRLHAGLGRRAWHSPDQYHTEANRKGDAPLTGPVSHCEEAQVRRRYLEGTGRKSFWCAAATGR